MLKPSPYLRLLSSIENDAADKTYTVAFFTLALSTLTLVNIASFTLKLLIFELNDSNAATDRSSTSTLEAVVFPIMSRFPRSFVFPAT